MRHVFLPMAVAVLLALAVPANAYDAYRLLLGNPMDTQCTVDISGSEYALPNFNFTAWQDIATPSGKVNYSIAVNPCLPASFPCAPAGGAYVVANPAPAKACTTSASFDEQVPTTAMWNNGTLTLTVTNGKMTASLTYTCDAGALTPVFIDGTYNATEGFKLRFASKVVCEPVTTTPAPTATDATTTAAPTGDDSGSPSLSTGAIVGIIAGSAVVVVALGVAVTKLRAGAGSAAESTYNKV